MVKQVLLRVSAVFAKIGFREFAQLLRRHFLSTRQIMLSQNSLDPDVDRECAEPLVCKEHHAICNLRSHTGQLAQIFSKIAIRKPRPSLEIKFTGADSLRCRAQIFGAITELAFAQFCLESAPNTLRVRKRVNHVIVNLSPLAETGPERRRDLANVRHLFHGRTDKCGETFPLRLANDPQAAAKIASRIHQRIIWK